MFRQREKLVFGLVRVRAKIYGIRLLLLFLLLYLLGCCHITLMVLCVPEQ